MNYNEKCTELFSENLYELRQKLYVMLIWSPSVLLQTSRFVVFNITIKPFTTMCASSTDISTNMSVVADLCRAIGSKANSEEGRSVTHKDIIKTNTRPVAIYMCRLSSIEVLELGKVR